MVVSPVRRKLKLEKAMRDRSGMYHYVYVDTVLLYAPRSRNSEVYKVTLPKAQIQLLREKGVVLKSGDALNVELHVIEDDNKSLKMWYFIISS